MKASPILTPVRSRAAISSSASAVFRPIGFSQSTCLPASAAWMRPRHVQVIRQRIVDRVDLRIGQHLLVRAVRLRNAQLARRGFGARPVARRDADDLAEFALLHRRNDAFTAIRATPRMPHRILAIGDNIERHDPSPHFFEESRRLHRRTLPSPT